MNNNYTGNYDMVNKMFIDNYFAEYKSLKLKNKSKLLQLLPSSYRKWFYSAFIEETILSPCTIFDRINKDKGSNSLVLPTPRFENPSNKSNFYFVDVEYSLDKHPMVNDLKTFLSLCEPNIDLTNDDILIESDYERFTNSLSLQDKFYVEYLFELSIHLKLLKKMPSIYSNKAQTTSRLESFFEKTDREILDKIIDACLEISSFEINSILPVPMSTFSKQYFLNLIKNPIPIDNFFEQVYSALGINIERFMLDMDMDNEEADSADIMSSYDGLGGALISSTYLLGVILDKYFLTPIGHYLKLITPMYYMPFNFKDELLYLYEGAKIDSELNPTVWSPCSNFFLTELGLEYFSVTPNEDNYLELPESIPINDLIENIKETTLLRQTINSVKVAETAIGNIYELKARVLSSKKFWFILEIHESSTLEDIHEQICDIFLLDYLAEYSISIGETESPFLKFVSENNKKKFKKASSAKIEDLSLDKNQKLIYYMPNTTASITSTVPTMKIELEITNIKEASPRVFYPIISKRSKTLIDWENKIDIDSFF